MWDDCDLWEGAKRGELPLRACARCNAICHPPLPVCPGCQSLSWMTQRVSGRGLVSDWIISTHPARPDAPPRTVVVVQLEEGVAFVSNLIGIKPNEIREGLPVELCFAEVDGIALPQFRAASQARDVP